MGQREFCLSLSHRGDWRNNLCSSILSSKATSAKFDSLPYSVNQYVGRSDVRHPSSSGSPF